MPSTTCTAGDRSPTRPRCSTETEDFREPPLTCGSTPDLDEVRRECRAQLERAIYWGFDVSHLDAHLDSVQLKPEFFDVFLDLAEEFALPLRLPDAGAQRLAGFPFRALASERGVVSPDRVILTGGSAGILGGSADSATAPGSAGDKAPTSSESFRRSFRALSQG